MSPAGTVLEKGVARAGLVGLGNYQYYKLQLSCVEAAQALTFTLSATNGRGRYKSNPVERIESLCKSASSPLGNLEM